MAKFIQVQLPTAGGYLSESRIEESSMYINVEMIKSVAQNAQEPDQCSIRFVGDEHALPIGESAASIISRAGAD
jgi:hypothetical protein